MFFSKIQSCWLRKYCILLVMIFYKNKHFFCREKVHYCYCMRKFCVAMATTLLSVCLMKTRLLFSVIRLDGTTPIKYGLRLNSEAKYIELKEQLHLLCNIAPERLLLAEIGYSQIRQILNDESRINPRTAIEIVAYELPETKKEENGVNEETEAG